MTDANASHDIASEVPRLHQVLHGTACAALREVTRIFAATYQGTTTFSNTHHSSQVDAQLRQNGQQTPDSASLAALNRVFGELSTAAAPNPPRLLVLVGIPGSGKSTLAARLQAEGGWAVVCQDVLGDRRACERAARRHLLAGRSVVIDRCRASCWVAS